MTSLLTPTEAPPAPPAPARSARLAVLVAALLGVGTVLALVHLTQGTSSIGPGDVLGLLWGGHGDGTVDVVVAARLPRLLAAIVVGVALGLSGAVLQSVSRNIIASPDTLAVNAGAHLAIVAVAAFGVSLPMFGAAGVAFLGGLGAAALVLMLSGAGGTGTARLVLAGTAIALMMVALKTTLLLLFAQETRGLFAWGEGSLEQNGLSGVTTFAPVVAVVLVALLAMSRRMDLVYVGDDHARALGVRVTAVRATAVVLAVLLSASAVVLTGPIGFVGLAAPALIRLLATAVPRLHRHAVLLPVAGLAGAVVMITADVLLRALIGSQRALEIPTGVVTTILGAIFLVVLARTLRVSGSAAEPPAAGVRAATSRTRYLVLLTGLVVLAVVVAGGGALLGDAKLLLGDLVNWVSGQAGPIVSGVMDNRLPRVLAALLAGASLALAGAVFQNVSRNPLAEPGIIGVTGGAGIGAVVVITLVPLSGFWLQAGAAGIGAGVAAALVFLSAARRGFASDNLVLIGFGVSAGTNAIIAMLITLTDPWNESKALTWLSGSTYGRTFEHLVPMMVALVIVVPVLTYLRGTLDLLSLDEETPRLLGVRVPGARLALLVCAVVLTGAAVAGVGVIGFVGLVAPHAARALVGRRSARVLPVAALLGAILVCVADLIGRSVIAPAQLPAGLVTAIVGTPYFIWLLYRGRR
ncbi:ABC transporter permease [Actinophytocola xinjiangensis]|uniref:ABC transporter permease n=1 Tax=Actinophytocola xinjiangensis TaxID=485602 RepID=A0A7Z1B0B5_9PSEU|nr:iron ABC transporter permease [Actinophytocola xinjiangensis]OLF13028.1 ABC transporter permease [Actinophytocola xinjiangensis]